MIQKLIIFPDIHGRDFWKAPIEKYKNDETVKFIFLGDYLDPYGFEGIDADDAWENFVELNEATKGIPEDRIVWLIGNHDFHYLKEFWLGWGCRRSRSHLECMSKALEDKKFKIAYEHKSPLGKKWLFTHAGVTFGWAKCLSNFWLKDELNGDLLKAYDANVLNKLMEPNKHGALWVVSFERGGDYANGSCIWADVHEHLDSYFDDKEPIYDKLNMFQVFGHTLSYPNMDAYFLGKDFAMLDSKQAFELDIMSGNIKPISI